MTHVPPQTKCAFASTVQIQRVASTHICLHIDLLGWRRARRVELWTRTGTQSWNKRHNIYVWCIYGKAYMSSSLLCADDCGDAHAITSWDLFPRTTTCGHDKKRPANDVRIPFTRIWHTNRFIVFAVHSKYFASRRSSHLLQKFCALLHTLTGSGARRQMVEVL